jgi:hypothetical protein
MLNKGFIFDMFRKAYKKKWYETYWAIDLHGTIIKPTYNGTEVEYYHYAKECLQILSKRKDIKLILWTCSHPHEIKEYINTFIKDNIVFSYINENPEIVSNQGDYGYYDDKFYFNILFDDKAGFDPEKDWETIYYELNMLNRIGYMPEENWSLQYKNNKMDPKYINVPNICFSLTSDVDEEEVFIQQRLERGFDDSETWSLRDTIANFILPRIKRFKEVTIGMPVGMTKEKWYDILDKMIISFELIVRNNGEMLLDDEEMKKMNKGLDLFKEYFLSLWW